MNTLVAAILAEVAARGISQKSLAASAGIPEETLSRMKRKPSVRSEALERLAKSAGLRLALLPASSASRDEDLEPVNIEKTLTTASGTSAAAPLRTGFRQKYRKLVWSNPEAPAEVFVRQALLKPDFSVLLDAATEFGLDFVDQQWTLLQAEASQEAVRATPVTQRMLRNIRHGYEQAAA